MILFKKILQIIVVLGACSITFNAFAVDQAAKEETSPPGDEGPLTAEQMPPVNNVTQPPGEVEPQKLPGESPAQSSQPVNSATLPSQQ